MATNRTVTAPSRAVARRRAAASWRARTSADSGSACKAGEADIVAVGSIWQPLGSRHHIKPPVWQDLPAEQAPDQLSQAAVVVPHRGLLCAVHGDLVGQAACRDGQDRVVPR